MGSIKQLAQTEKYSIEEFEPNNMVSGSGSSLVKNCHGLSHCPAWIDWWIFKVKLIIANESDSSSLTTVILLKNYSKIKK